MKVKGKDVTVPIAAKFGVGQLDIQELGAPLEGWYGDPTKSFSDSWIGRNFQ